MYEIENRRKNRVMIRVIKRRLVLNSLIVPPRFDWTSVVLSKSRKTKEEGAHAPPRSTFIVARSGAPGVH